MTDEACPAPPARPDRSWPVRLADTIPPPENPRPEARPARALPVGIEPMLSLDDVAAWLNCSRRVIERMRSAGKVPKPDIKIGKMPRWRVETIRRWIERGGRA